MSRHAIRALVSLLVTSAPLSAFASNYVGINGSTCDFDSVQEALDDPSQPTTIWIAQGYHTDPGFLVERDLIAVRGTASCASGGSGSAALDFEDGGRAELQSDLRVTMDDISLLNGVGTTGGNLLVGADTVAVLTHVGLTGGNATDGGGVAVSAGATLDVRGATFWGNDATGSGGGIFGAAGSKVDLGSGLGVDLIFLDNDAANGGGVMCDDCTLSLNAPYGYDVSFSLNDATGSGGALSVIDGSVSIAEASFQLNTAADGGAISLEGSVVSDFSLLDFTENQASDDGGAVFAHDISTFVLDTVDFTENVAGGDGGGVFASDSDLDADDCDWFTNSAARGGGVFLTAAGGTFNPRIRHANLRDNAASASTTGSAVDVHSASHTLTVSNSVVVGGVNSIAPGAALVAQTGADLVLKDITVADNQRWGVATLTGSTATLAGSIIWGNGSGGVTGTGTATCSDLQGVAPSGSNINANPLFTDPTTDDYTVQTTSPALGACAAHAGTALNGVNRNVGASDMGGFDH